MKTFGLNFLVWNGVRYEYFYQREKNDRNGNPRYCVYLFDPEAKAVHGMIFKCYECQIENSLKLKLDRLIDAEEDRTMITFAAPTIIGTFILKAAFLIACMIAAGLVIAIDAGF